MCRVYAFNFCLKHKQLWLYVCSDFPATILSELCTGVGCVAHLYALTTFTFQFSSVWRTLYSFLLWSNIISFRAPSYASLYCGRSVLDGTACGYGVQLQHLCRSTFRHKFQRTQQYFYYFSYRLIFHLRVWTKMPTSYVLRRTLQIDCVNLLFSIASLKTRWCHIRSFFDAFFLFHVWNWTGWSWLSFSKFNCEKDIWSTVINAIQSR